MRSIAVIHVSNQKADTNGPPRQVWRASRFQLYLAHAEMFCDEVYVLSDEYGLISPDAEIEPYDTNVDYANPTTLLKWWAKVKRGIRELAQTQPDIVVMYVGNFERERMFREFVRNGVYNVTLPFGGREITLSERLDRIMDADEPFDAEKLTAGAYSLPEGFGEPKKRGRKPAEASEADSLLPKDDEDIVWEDEDEDLTEAE